MNRRALNRCGRVQAELGYVQIWFHKEDQSWGLDQQGNSGGGRLGGNLHPEGTVGVSANPKFLSTGKAQPEVPFNGNFIRLCFFLVGYNQIVEGMKTVEKE